jgi:hypothetical protein
MRRTCDIQIQIDGPNDQRLKALFFFSVVKTHWILDPLPVSEYLSPELYFIVSSLSSSGIKKDPDLIQGL